MTKNILFNTVYLKSSQEKNNIVEFKHNLRFTIIFMEFRFVISKITLYLIEHFKSITVLFRNGVILVYQ